MEKSTNDLLQIPNDDESEQLLMKTPEGVMKKKKEMDRTTPESIESHSLSASEE